MINKPNYLVEIYCIDDQINAYPLSTTIENDSYHEYPDKLSLQVSDYELGKKVVEVSKRSIKNLSDRLDKHYPYSDFGFSKKKWLLFIKKAKIFTVEKHPGKNEVLMVVPSIKHRNGWSADLERRIEVNEGDFTEIGFAIKSSIS